jgi:hypothetical protein
MTFEELVDLFEARSEQLDRSAQIIVGEYSAQERWDRMIAAMQWCEAARMLREVIVGKEPTMLLWHRPVLRTEHGEA